MIALLRITHLKILKSPSLWISIIFVVFFLAFAPNAFGGTIDLTTNDIPYGGYPGAAEAASKGLSIQVSSAIIITGLLLTVVTSFGEAFVKIKNSLLYQNLELSNKPKIQFYVATLTPVVVYSTLMFILSMVFFVTFDSIGLIGIEKNIMDWGNVQWGYLLLALTTTITLGISIALLISALSKTQNTYTALTWAYLFLIFFFGGASVPIFLIRGDGSLAAFMYLSFLIPNTFSNFLFVNSMVGQVGFDEVVNILDVVLPIILSGTFIGVRQLILLTKK